MKEIKLYNKLEDFTVEYEIKQLSPSTKFDDQISFIDHSIASVKETQSSVNEKIDLLTANLSELDYSVSVASGILSGLIDSVFVGEFSLDRGASWGNDKVNNFVKWVAKKQGYEGGSLAGAVSHLEKNNKKIDIVVNLETPEDEILERVVNRRICTNSSCKAVYNTVLNPSKVPGICDKCGSKLVQRDDDKLEKAKKRLEVYYKETAPVADYYKGTGALYSTVLSQSVNRMKDEVAKDVIEYLKNK